MIRSGSESDEEAALEDGNTNNNANTNANANATHNNTNENTIQEVDSLSEVLKEESERTRSDSLSEILNGTSSNITNNTNHAINGSVTENNSHTPTPPLKKKIPPRLKMNAHPARHWTEIRNFCEFYTVTKFNWSYLSLRSKEELSRRNSHMNHSHNSRSNSHSRSNGNGHSQSNSNSRSRSRPRVNRNNHNNNNNSNNTTDTAISTISIAFSPDGRTVASTHGDHTVKITCCNTGALIRNLEGHPRTPWTVKYHPTKPNLVASGCLGFQVRVWDWNYGMANRDLNGHLIVAHRDVNGHLIENGNGNGNSNSGTEFNCVEDQYNYENGKGVCLSMIRLTSSIISLSFHPTGSLLAVASGHSLHLWVYDDAARKRGNDTSHSGANTTTAAENNDNSRRITNTNANNGNRSRSSSQHNRGNGNGNDSNMNMHRNGNVNGSHGNGANNSINHQNQHGRSRGSSNGNNGGGGGGASSGTSTIITQIRYEHNLRCVHFPPGGNTIILGGVNPPQGETSYSLRLWDFDLEVALNPQLYLGQDGQIFPMEENERAPLSLKRDALKNFRTFVPRALLYNDGGFDVSPDGRMLCGCAEYWLPDGVNSAMELIEKKDELAWIEEERNETKNANERVPGDSKKTIVRSPRRKLNRSHRSKEEKRLKESSGARVNEGRSGAHSPLDRPAPRSAGCRTPPNPIRPQVLTSPPSPPGRRWSLTFGGSRPMPLGSGGGGGGGQNVPPNQIPQQNNSDGPPPPPLPPNYRSGMHTNGSMGPESGGRFVPHVVVVNLDKKIDKNGDLGQVLEATPLGSRASSVTCVKFSPSAEFCLLGYGVREHATQPHGQQYHPVTALYRIRGGISHIATMLSSDDDVNIARFHPQSGQGFVYGTKQGRVRVLSPRPWDQYYE